MTAEILEQPATPAMDWATLEKVYVQGDLKGLTSGERIQYVRMVCDATGLNPATQPFELITLNGRLTLYATKRCTDQLRQIHRVSITRIEQQMVDDLFMVTAYAQTPDGRSDSDIGAVSLGTLKGEGRANQVMKCITKSKRRVTLSICGLGFLDESEVDSIPGARETVRPVDVPSMPTPANRAQPVLAESPNEIGADDTWTSTATGAPPQVRDRRAQGNRMSQACIRLAEVRDQGESWQQVMHAAADALEIHDVTTIGELSIPDLIRITAWADAQHAKATTREEVVI